MFKHRLRGIRWLCIAITPFIWHRPQVDRSIEADPVFRIGPINISGPLF